MEETALAVFFDHGQILIRKHHFVIGEPVTDFQIMYVLIGLIDQMVGVAIARLKAGAHAGCHERFTGIGNERRLAFHDIDEFVIDRMRVTDRRVPARRKFGKIHAKDRETKKITQRMFDALAQALRKFGGK